MWIIAHTIKIGTKKAFVVLRRYIDVMKYGRSLTKNDMEVVCIEIQTQSTGEKIKNILSKLSIRIGMPFQIISDCGSDIKKGIREFAIDKDIKVTYDITHLVANLFKKSIAICQFLKI